MPDLDSKISELETRLEQLVRTQIGFQSEIASIRNELKRLRRDSHPQAPPSTAPLTAEQRFEPPILPPSSSAPRSADQQISPPTFLPPAPAGSASTQNDGRAYVPGQTLRVRSDLEGFIGENLISKIGILILILGVGIGAKYAIDNDLVSPLTRIVIGYGFGLGLLALAAKLKEKYRNFSAVLLGGSLAIMYFITYFAYAAYQLIGQITAFPLMVILTAFAVVCALLYNRQVIAHVGLVGAYAVPFLLGSDSERYAVLFSYMAVVNAGILAISVRKYWRPIFYTASCFTWLIFAFWFARSYEFASHFYLALAFLGIFASIFYATKVAHGIIHPGRDETESTLAILGTGFVFYCFCAALGDVRTSVVDYAIFFSYVCAAAILVLVSSLNRHARVLVYLAYPFSWILFGLWFVRYYSADEHFLLACAFAAAFFAVFYVAGLVYKLSLDDLEDPLAAGLLLTNSFIFYGVTIGIARSRESTSGIDGAVTLAHAALHGVVSQVVGRIRSDSTLVVQTLTVLVLTFATVAVPIQFNGNVVTIVWALEAAVLFSLGRLRGLSLFEYFSYPLIALASLSMFADWVMIYHDRLPNADPSNRTPFANGDLITALVLVVAFSLIYVVNRDDKYEPPIGRDIASKLSHYLVAAAIFVLYNALRIEISNFHHYWLVTAVRRFEPATPAADDLVRDIGKVNVLAQLTYSMVFLAAMTAVNLLKSRSRTVAAVAAGLCSVALVVFATLGMVLMYELRISYMAGTPGTPVNILVRYAVYLATAVMLTSQYANLRDPLSSKPLGLSRSRTLFESVFTGTLFLALSFELVNLVAQFSLADGTKLGLSVLWGVYALGMVVYGIARDVKYQRIAAISLLAVTLVKLFFYDISNLGTIPKTILFITLGILLLIVSFLYNKYKNLIFAAAGADASRDGDL